MCKNVLLNCLFPKESLGGGLSVDGKNTKHNHYEQVLELQQEKNRTIYRLLESATNVIAQSYCI